MAGEIMVFGTAVESGEADRQILADVGWEP